MAFQEAGTANAKAQRSSLRPGSFSWEPLLLAASSLNYRGQKLVLP